MKTPHRTPRSKAQALVAVSSERMVLSVLGLALVVVLVLIGSITGGTT